VKTESIQEQARDLASRMYSFGTEAKAADLLRRLANRIDELERRNAHLQRLAHLGAVVAESVSARDHGEAPE